MRTALLSLAVLAGTAAAGDPLVREAQQVDPGFVGATVNPSVASDGDLVAVSFFNTDSDSVFVVTSDGRGTTWSAPVKVDGDTTGATKIANFDACGVIGDRVYVVWKDERNGSTTDDVAFNYSTDGGATFPPGNELILDDGYGNTGTVRNWRSAFSAVPGGDDHIYVLMASDGAEPNEELFLVVSTDGGASFSDAMLVAGDAENWDVDALAIAADEDVCHIMWSSDASSPGANLESVYYRSYDASSESFSSVIQLDALTDATDEGDAQFSGNYSFDIDADGALVLAGWREARASASEPELRVAYSLDGGASFGADQRVGESDPTFGDEVDFSHVAIVGGNFVAAYTDNRLSLGTLDDVYVSVIDDPINGNTAWVESGPLSGAEGGSAVRVAGGGGDVAVTYTSDLSGNQYAGAAVSVDGGLSWTTDLRVSDDGGGSDADIAELGYNPRYQNFVHAFLSNVTGNTNNLFLGGYRPQTLTPVGWVAGTTNVSFEFERFAPGSVNSKGLVLLAFSLADGQFAIPFGRESGLAFDALTNFGFNKLPLLIVDLDASGAGSTPSPLVDLPSGVTFYAVGLGFSTGFGSSMRLSDPVRIDL